MAIHISRARFAVLMAVILVIFISGVVAGAAGGPFILGAANSAGTSNSSLTTSSTGNALLVTQNGTGTAIRGSTGSGSGIAGFFTSGSGSGVSGVVANENSYGSYAANDSTSEGTGAALRVNGKQNEGIIVNSDDTNAIRAFVTSCDGFILCGGDGVSAKGYGFGAAVFADGTDSLAGVWAQAAAANFGAVFGSSDVTDVPAVYASSTDADAVYGLGEGAPDTLTSLANAGGHFAGINGVIGETDTIFGAGVYAKNNNALNFALFADGNSAVTGNLDVDGNLNVDGTCTGCTLSVVAANGSGANLRQGDAVTLMGVQTAANGSLAVVVGKAKAGDAVFGIVDRSLELSPTKATQEARTRTTQVKGQGAVTVKTPARAVSTKYRSWLTKGTSVPAKGYLRVVTSGIFAYEAAAPNAAVGDRLSVSSSGSLAKAGASPAAGSVAGKFLGTLKDGRIVILVGAS